MKKTKLSQTRTGEGAVLLAIFAVAYDISVGLQALPVSGPFFWIKITFIALGVVITWVAVHLCRRYLQGGNLSMALSHDPVPHGVPVIVEFQFDRAIRAEQWQVEINIQQIARHQSSFGLIWSQEFAASPIEPHLIRAEVILPSDFPSTAASDSDTTYRVMLSLTANGFTWAFALETRAGSASEMQFGTHNASNIGNNQRASTPEQMAAARKQLAT